MNRPAVSVVMITYGHENYIEEAIRGVLMQQCNFDVELIIANDCSPDKTDDVIQNILKTHPNSSWIKYIKHKKNIGMMPNFIFALKQAQGKYIALCEGDDYWTDPYKLQSQVDFLDSNTDFSLICSRYTIFDEITQMEESYNFGLNFVADEHGKPFEEKMNVWVQLLTIMFRKSDLVEIPFKKYKYFRDIHLLHHLLLRGKGYYLNKIGGVYRLHPGGASSKIDPDANNFSLYLVLLEIVTYYPTFKSKKQFSAVAAQVFLSKLKRKDLLDNPFKYVDVINISLFLFCYYIFKSAQK